MQLNSTAVYETYWRFAAERQAIYYRRLADPVGPWTSDPILQSYRFTNVYRAADRVSQYLIREIQYRPDRSQDPNEVFFRTILYKLFNRIDTWENLERDLGLISWQETSIDHIKTALDNISLHNRIYSAAYIMPSPAYGYERKHANHLALLLNMMMDGVPEKLAGAKSLQAVYKTLLSYPGIGPFLAYQFSIDLNYSRLFEFDEASFVIAGPGAIDGIAKCFKDSENQSADYIIREMVNRQEEEFSRLGIKFPGLFGRPLQLIDCQNLFCEISKYARAAHPDVQGASGRTRIKQRYRVSDQSDSSPFFPPRWGLEVDAPAKPRLPIQPRLL